MVINVIFEQEEVKSFNGRTGAVVPATGDYTAAMVGARSNTWMPTAADVGAVTSTQVNTLIGNKIKYGTTDIGVGASLETGAIYLVYT